MELKISLVFIPFIISKLVDNLYSVFQKRILIEAVSLRENARDIDQAIIEIDSYIYRLQQIATEVSYRGFLHDCTWA